MDVRRAVSVVALTPAALLLSCGGGGRPFTPPTYTLAVSPQPATAGVGTTVTFTATTNAPSVSWVLVSTSGTSVSPPTDAGSPNSQLSGSTFVYTAPASPPVYSDNIKTAGTVTVRAMAVTTTVDTTFTITAPAITTGFYTPSSTSVSLGSTLVVNAYAVGSTNNALILQVNGITGGSAAVGTIAAPPFGIYGEYVYTAPAAMPMTGNTITLTVISQADPAKSSKLALTLH